MSFDGKSGSVLPDCEVEVEQEAMVDEEKKKSKITRNVGAKARQHSLRDIDTKLRSFVVTR